MSAFKPFKYIESIQANYRSALTSELRIESNISEEALLIRLLLGTISCKHKLSGEIFTQKNNYSNLGIVTNNIISTKPIKDYLSPLVLDDLNRFLRKNKYLNKTYFQDLLAEFTWYFYKSEKGEHTVAFIHLYRIVEYISYSFPLIYTSISRDYYGSFNSLKKYFDDSNSELKFFSVFFKKLFEDEIILDSPINFTFSENEDMASAHIGFIKSFYSQKIESESPGVSISIKFKNAISLCIEIRNRFFHFAVGGRQNASTLELREPDIFFQSLNDQLINCIAFIYLEILGQLIESERD